MLRVEIVAILETVIGKTFYAIPENHEKKEKNILEYIDKEDENKLYKFNLYSYGDKETSGHYPDFIKVYPVFCECEPDIEKAIEVEIRDSLFTLKGIPKETNIRWFCNVIK